MNKKEAADVLAEAFDKMLEREKTHLMLKASSGNLRRIGQALKCLGYENNIETIERLEKEQQSGVAAAVERLNEGRRAAFDMTISKIINSSIVTAFDESTIGTKVTNQIMFHFLLAKAVSAFDFTKTRVPGQGLIELPAVEAIPTISGGMGKHTNNPEDYIARRHWSGQVHLYLRRQFAVAPKGVSVVVYTREAYLGDPDTMKDAEETKRIAESDAKFVLVAILTNYFDKAPPLPVGTFVRNLAGANREALVWTADEIRAKAREIQEFHEGWCVVAD